MTTLIYETLSRICPSCLSMHYATQSKTYRALFVLLALVCLYITLQSAHAQTEGTEKSGEITVSETWTASGSPYILNGPVTIAAAATVTIQPGVTVLAQGGSELLLIQGSLQAIGTADQGIVFTSENDAPVQWGGLIFDGSDGSGTAQLNYVTVQNAGAPNSVKGGNINVTNVNNGQVVIENSRLLSNGSVERIINDPTSDALYISNSNVVVRHTEFADNGSDANDYPLQVTGESILVVSDNTFANNTLNRILINGDVRIDRFSKQTGLEAYVLAGDLTVDSGTTMTIDPGVVMAGSGNIIQVEGELQALGTSDEPIRLTSSADLNEAAARGQWRGLLFNGGTGHLRYVTINAAGYDNRIEGSDPSSAIALQNVQSGRVLIEQSRITNSGNGTPFPINDPAHFALLISNSNAHISNSRIDTNGEASNDRAVYVTGSSTQLTIQDSTIENNTGPGLAIAGGSTTVNCSSILSNGTDGVYVEDGNLTIRGSEISGNTEIDLNNTTSTAIDARYNWWGSSSGPSSDMTSGSVTVDPWLESQACVADLAISAELSAETVVASDILTYTITVDHTGGGTVSDASVTVELPTSVTLLETTPDCTGISNIVCPLGTIVPEDSATITIVSQVNPDTEGTFGIQSEIDSSEVFDTNADDNTTTQNFLVEIIDDNGDNGNDNEEPLLIFFPIVFN